MKAERLHNLLHDLLMDVEQYSIPPKLQQFRDLFHQSVTQVTPQSAGAFTELRNTLWGELKRMPSNALAQSGPIVGELPCVSPRCC